MSDFDYSREMTTPDRNAAIQPIPVKAKPGVQAYGCFPARIGWEFDHKIEKDLTLPSGRLLKRGFKIHLGVQNILNYPIEAQSAEWVCRHPECRGKRWPSAGALCADHPRHRDMVTNQEAHCYYAVAWTERVEAKEAKVNKAGETLEEAVEAKPSTILLLSNRPHMDEER